MSDPNAEGPAPDSLSAELAKSLIRHGVSVLSGVLVSAGAVAPDDQTQFIAIASGVAFWLFSQGWSALRKVARAKL